MNPIRELRVHGVSGTPPRDILYTDPVPRLDGDRYARVFRTRPSLSHRHPSGRAYDSEAFHWGSLTTGHWLTSLWVFLAPFAFANVAGWMAVRRAKHHIAAIRLAGLALTSLFVAQIGYVIVGVPLSRAIGAGWEGTGLLLTRAGSSLAWVLIFGAIVLRLSTQSHFDPLDYGNRFELLFTPTLAAMKPPKRPDDAFDDPASERVTGRAMWKEHSILHRLRRIHFAAGQLVVALVLSRASGEDNLTWVAVGGLLVTLLLIVATTYRPGSRWVLVPTAWAPIFAEAIAVAGVVLFALSEKAPQLDVFHATSFHLAIALGVAAALSLVAGVPAIGALTIATFLGGAFGVGVGLVAEDVLKVESALVAQGGAWVLPASLVFVLFVVLVGVTITFRGPPALARKGLSVRLLTRLTRRSHLLLAAAAFFGLIAGAFAIFEGCDPTELACDPASLREVTGANVVVIGLLMTILVLVAVRVAAYRWGVSAVLVAAAGLLAWAWATDPVLLGIRPRDYLLALPLSRTVIFVAPVLAILRSVLGAYRQGASSRKVGIVWDVVSFWPRWFHPLGPPAYGPRVVDELERLIRAGEVEVLAGHSQGSVIAAVAARQASTGPGARTPSGLLTYGSPIGLLYRKLFPDTGMDDLLREVPRRLDRGWVNLSRVDDPIGGEPLGGGVVDVVEDAGSGHSGYELTKVFRDQRDKMA